MSKSKRRRTCPVTGVLRQAICVHRGIHADDECPGPRSTPSGNSNTIENKTVNEACAGILEGSGSGNVFSPNTFSNVTNTLLAGDSGGIVCATTTACSR